MSSESRTLIETYLDDLARMLAGADPVLRAEVLGGVREHVDAALERRDRTSEADVDGVLTELGPPEAVATAALEGEGGAVSAEDPRPPATDAGVSRPRGLERSWVPPTVGLLLLVTMGIYLLALAGGVMFLATTGVTDVAGTSPSNAGAFHAPEALDAAAVANPLLPATYDVLWSAVVPLFLVGLPWLVAVVLLAASPLWTRRETWAGALLLPGAALLNVALLAALASSPGSGGGVAVLVVTSALLVTAAAAVVVVTHLWRVGAGRAHEATAAWRHRSGTARDRGPSSSPAGPPPGLHRPPVLARPWVPALAVTLLVIGLLIVLVLSARGFAPGGGHVPPAPVHAALTPILLAALLPPVWAGWVLGAVLVTLSPLWRASEKVAAWLLVPGLSVLLALAAHLVHLSDREYLSLSGAVDPGAVLAVLTLTMVLAVAGAVVVLARIARAGSTRARAAEREGRSTWSAVADHEASVAWRERWWVPLLVTMTLGAAGIAGASFPVLLAGRLHELVVDGEPTHLVWDGSRQALLTGLVWVLPLWLVAVTLVVASPLWGRWATVSGVVVVPALLGAGMLLTTGERMTGGQADRLAVATAVLALLVGVVVARLYAMGARAARRREEGPLEAPSPAPAPVSYLRS